MTDGPPRVYLDTNVFIAAFEAQGAISDHAWWILRAIEADEIVAATSELTLAELLVKPLQSGATELAAGYKRVVAPTRGFEVSPVRRDILLGAAGLRAWRASMKLPDAIHVATAQALSCRYFVSDDRRLALPGEIQLLHVTPFTLDDIFRRAS